MDGHNKNKSLYNLAATLYEFRTKRITRDNKSRKSIYDILNNNQAGSTSQRKWYEELDLPNLNWADSIWISKRKT